jgi:hypothetical protein
MRFFEQSAIFFKTPNQENKLIKQSVYQNYNGTVVEILNQDG